MKLFGGKHNTQRTGGHAGSERAEPSAARSRKPGGRTPRAASGAGKKCKLTGVQRGILLLIGSLAVLALVVFGVYKALVRPMERPSQSIRNDSADTGDDSASRPNHTITYVDDDGNTVETQFEAPGSYVDGVYNILLLGLDDDGTRTDTIMIAHLDARDHTVALLSIPRDTYIYGNYAVPKINSVYGGDGEEGVERLKETLASMLGFQVDGYVLVDLQAFVEIIDLVGGITFDVPQRMYYSDPTQNLYIDLYAGLQTLNGKQAMGLVRYRSGYAAADIRRVEVQREFLQAAAEQLLSLKTLTQLQSIVETCIQYVKTDLTLGNILYFAQELLKCDLDAMESFTLPGNGVGLSSGSYYSAYPSQVLEMVNEYFNPYDTDISASSLHLRTASSSSSSGSSGSSGSSSSSSSGGSSGDSTTTPSETVPEEPTDGGETTTPSEPTETDPNNPNGSGALEPENPSTGDSGDTGGTTDSGEGGETVDGGGGSETTDGSGGTDGSDSGTTTTSPGTGTTDPGTTDPGTTDPGTTDPGTTDPGTTDPGTDGSDTSEGTDTTPTTPDPGTAENGSDDGAAGIESLDPGSSETPAASEDSGGTTTAAPAESNGAIDPSAA